jgi:2-polyprenyl-3-methyl-5-hydroxy-6-metoxy-1,4-benzoquinol methylase
MPSNASSYKDRFYERYATSHLVTIDGEATVALFHTQSKLVYRSVKRFLPVDRSAKVIDVGCGNGTLVYALQKVGYTHAMGIDVSRELVDQAKRFGVTNVRQLSVWDLTTSNDQYDMIILRDVIEHFGKEEIISLMNDLHRILAPAGRVLIHVPNAESPFFGRIRYGDFTHDIAFCQRSLAQLFNISGFVHHEFYSDPPSVTGLRTFFRFVLWKHIEWLFRVLLYAELGGWRRIVTQNIYAICQR